MSPCCPLSSSNDKIIINASTFTFFAWRSWWFRFEYRVPRKGSRIFLSNYENHCRVGLINIILSSSSFLFWYQFVTKFMNLCWPEIFNVREFNRRRIFSARIIIKIKKDFSCCHRKMTTTTTYFTRAPHTYTHKQRCIRQALSTWHVVTVSGVKYIDDNKIYGINSKGEKGMA